MTSDQTHTHKNRLAGCDAEVAQAIAALIACYEREGKLLVCGNGGSAADAEHIVGEMMKGFCLPRGLSDTDKTQLAFVAAMTLTCLAQNCNMAWPRCHLSAIPL